MTTLVDSLKQDLSNCYLIPTEDVQRENDTLTNRIVSNFQVALTFMAQLLPYLLPVSIFKAHPPQNPMNL